jgi:RNA-directed DNA polymerase
MTAATTAGAASHSQVDWHAIDWPKVYRTVRRLQARIVQAQQAGKPGKVKALQRLLTHSFSGKALAVRRVTENHGKRTPGVDGETWNTPAKKAAAIGSLGRLGYRPQPARRIYIPKSNGKQRPLGILTMQDRAMQALYLLALDPLAETTADANSYGFRVGRSTADAIEQCHTLLARTCSAPWILEGDIRSCFDKISFDWIRAHIPLPQRLLSQWLSAGYMEQHILYPTDEGLPQGGVLSPVIANLTLDGLEHLLRCHFPKRKHGNPKVNLVRFADDFVITGASQTLLEEAVKPLVERFLQARGLELSQEKTRITHIEDGFDFLGFHLHKRGKGAHKTLLITPAKHNVTAFLRKVRAVIKANKQATAGRLIFLLNPLIRGWANYYRHVASTATFCKVDHAIFICLWQWAKRRHPTKPRAWVKQKYFPPRNGQQWVFQGTFRTTDGTAQHLTLLHAAKVPSERHIKIRSQANPYDPRWQRYFEQRRAHAMERHLRQRKELLALWKEQGGRCPVCHQPFDLDSFWHNHHVTPSKDGGDDDPSNRVLLHPNCHRQVHSRDGTVAQPRPDMGVRTA